MKSDFFTQVHDIDGVVIRKLQPFKDERGFLTEFFRMDEIDAALQPVMGYLSVTNPGVSRGPHEHIDQTDYFFFPGPGDFLLSLWDNRPASSTYRKRLAIITGESNTCTVVIPPRVVHAYHCISTIPGICINIPNRLYRGDKKLQPVDEVRHEADPVSPFLLDFMKIIKERRS